MSGRIHITGVTFGTGMFTLTVRRSDGSEETVATDSDRARELLGEAFGSGSPSATETTAVPT